MKGQTGCPGHDMIVVCGPFASHKVHSEVGVDRVMSELEWPNCMIYKKPYVRIMEASDCLNIHGGYRHPKRHCADFKIKENLNRINLNQFYFKKFMCSTFKKWEE